MDSTLELGRRRTTTIAFDSDYDVPDRRGFQRRASVQSISSIRTATSDQLRRHTASRAMEPQIAAPPIFRTLSIHVDETREKTGVEAVKIKDAAAAELSQEEWHTLSIDEIYTRLSTSEAGLDLQQVERKRTQVGSNTPSPPKTHYFHQAFMYMFSGFGSLLLIAGILVTICYEPLGTPPQASNLALAVVLYLVFVIQALFNAYQDWSSSKVMKSIGSMIPAECIVIRDKQQCSIPAAQLVPGDVVLIRMGQKVPADLRIVVASGDLKFDRSVLTGESAAVSGTVSMTDVNYLESKNIAMQGTFSISGTGIGVVVATGDRTIFGRIAKLSSSPRNEMTPLQKELLRFSIIIASMALVTAIFVIIIWAAWLRTSYPNWLSTPALIVSVVSVLVAFVPEGLPVAVTTCLTIIAAKMKKHLILCKSLSTVETLGSINILLSDKTGTLTKNSMSVVNVAIADDPSSLTRQEDYGPERFLADSLQHDAAMNQLHHVASLCNAAQFEATTANLPIHERKINGDATDSAILRFAETLKTTSLITNQWKTAYDLPFNSKNKFMLRLVSPMSAKVIAPSVAPSEVDDLTMDNYILFAKGAPDIVINRCSRYVSTEGEVLPLDLAMTERLTEIQTKWATIGQRVLLLARRIVKSSEIPDISLANTQPFADRILALSKNDLVVVGLVGIVDPPRGDIPDVVRVCRNAGIRFFMVTGDFKLTAAAIARQCGIVSSFGPPHDVSNLRKSIIESDGLAAEKLSPPATPAALVISGPDLINLSAEHWDILCQYQEIVFARTTPEQKLRIVKEFQARGNVCGMTGDGVNDAPSLKAADIGIAMGSGSEVAMGASDMVLLDNFSAVVIAIESGRLVFDNLRKTIVYLLPAGSFSELWPVLFNVLIGIPQALSSFLMIIICLFTDCAASMTLVFEKPESDLLTRRPRDIKKDHIVNWRLLFHAYWFIGIIECFCAMSMYFWSIIRNGVPFSAIVLGFGTYNTTIPPDQLTNIFNQGSSIYFVTLVVMQMFNLFATRTRRLSLFQQPPIINPHTRNYYLFPALVFSLCIACFFLYIPFFQNIIATTNVAIEYWLLPITFGLGLLMLDEARKYALRRWPQGLIAWIAW